MYSTTDHRLPSAEYDNLMCPEPLWVAKFTAEVLCIAKVVSRSLPFDLADFADSGGGGNDGHTLFVHCLVV